jgi:isopropylmalate/homocitrate/citramalate synthase
VTQEEVVGAVVDALERLGVVYMVCGSFASNLHGVPRMTQDADLVIEIDEPGVLGLVRELEKDFYVSEEAAREAVHLRRLFNAIHLATGFKVDLVVRKDRPFSVAELARRTRGALAGRPVSFASAEDTILTKLEWARDTGSDRQLADAQGIIQIQAASLDWLYLERWADDLGVRDLLEDARRDGSAST